MVECRGVRHITAVQRKAGGVQSKGKRKKGKGYGKEKEHEPELEREQEKGQKGKGKAEVKQEEKRGWIPVAQFWEFKMRKKLKYLSTRLRLSFEMNSLTPSASGAPEGENHSCICYELPLRGEKSTPLRPLLPKVPPWVLKDNIQATWRVPGPPRGLAKLLSVLVEG